MKIKEKILGGLAGLVLSSGANAYFVSNLEVAYNPSNPKETYVSYNINREANDKPFNMAQSSFNLYNKSDNTYLGKGKQISIMMGQQKDYLGVNLPLNYVLKDTNWDISKGLNVEIQSFLTNNRMGVGLTNLDLSFYYPESQDKQLSQELNSFVPEPSTLGLLGIGGLSLIRRKK